MDEHLRLEFWVVLVSGLVMVLSGFVEFWLFDKSLGVGFLALGFGAIAIAFALRSEGILQESRRSEVDEKLAVMYGYQGKDAERVLSDLEALERVASSATKNQLGKIVAEGSNLVDLMQKRGFHDAAQKARNVLEKIATEARKSDSSGQDEWKPGRSRHYGAFLIIALLLTGGGVFGLIGYALGYSNHLNSVGTNIVVGWSSIDQVKVNLLEIGISPGTLGNDTGELNINLWAYSLSNQTFTFALLSPYSTQVIGSYGNGTWTSQNYGNLGSATYLTFTPNPSLKSSLIMANGVFRISHLLYQDDHGIYTAYFPFSGSLGLDFQNAWEPNGPGSRGITLIGSPNIGFYADIPLTDVVTNSFPAFSSTSIPNPGSPLAGMQALYFPLNRSTSVSMTYENPNEAEMNSTFQVGGIFLLGLGLPLLIAVSFGGGRFRHKSNAKPVEVQLEDERRGANEEMGQTGARVPALAKPGLKRDKLDDAFLFVLAIATLGFTVVQTSSKGTSSLVSSIPVLLSGVALPFYVGYLRGAVLLDSRLERTRGWVILAMGNFVMLALLATDLTHVGWVLYAVSFAGLGAAGATGLLIARAYPLPRERRTWLAIAGGATTGFVFPIVAYLVTNFVSTVLAVPEASVALLFVIYLYLILVFASILISSERTSEALTSGRSLGEYGTQNPKWLDLKLRELSQHWFFSPLDYLSVVMDPISHRKKIIGLWMGSLVVLSLAGYTIKWMPANSWPVILLALTANGLIMASIIIYLMIKGDHLLPK